MNTTSKQAKNAQRSMKEFTSTKNKTNKRTLSTRSPPNKKQAKKIKYLTTPMEESHNQNSLTTNRNGDKTNEEIKHITPDKLDHPENESNAINHPPNAEAQNTSLEGALGPLVHQIKLLRETFDDQYTKLEDKYTRLETVITSQKKEMSEELNKLQCSISNQKAEITSCVNERIDKSEAKLKKYFKRTSLSKNQMQPYKSVCQE